MGTPLRSRPVPYQVQCQGPSHPRHPLRLRFLRQRLRGCHGGGAHSFCAATRRSRGSSCNSNAARGCHGRGEAQHSSPACSGAGSRRSTTRAVGSSRGCASAAGPCFGCARTRSRGCRACRDGGRACQETISDGSHCNCHRRVSPGWWRYHLVSLEAQTDRSYAAACCPGSCARDRTLAASRGRECLDRTPGRRGSRPSASGSTSRRVYRAEKARREAHPNACPRSAGSQSAGGADCEPADPRPRCLRQGELRRAGGGERHQLMRSKFWRSMRAMTMRRRFSKTA